MPKRRAGLSPRNFEAQVVLEVLPGRRSASESARQHKLKPELISRRKDIALEGLVGLFQSDDPRGRDPERIAELERMVRRLTMELEVARKPRPCSPRSRDQTGGRADADRRVPGRLDLSGDRLAPRSRL